VHAGCEALFVGDTDQEPLQLLAFGRIERGEQRLLVSVGAARERFELGAAGGGQVQGVAAAVVGSVAPFDQAALFEAVDERDEAAGQRLPPRVLDHAQQALALAESITGERAPTEGVERCS
jgi:hypothetical protein